MTDRSDEVRKAFHEVAGRWNKLLFQLGALISDMEHNPNLKTRDDILKELKAIDQKGAESAEAFKALKRRVYDVLGVDNSKPLKEGERNAQ